MDKEKKIKTIFMGTPDFACPSLEALIKNSDFEVVLVVTQKDKKVGRKQIITPPPIKILAEKNNIPVIQPEKIKEAEDILKKHNPDFIVVAAYGQIIPQSILDIPKYGPFNVHASLLPKYRGAAVISAPILNGDKKSGITIMKMEAGLDTGPILMQKEITLDKNETSESLFKKLSQLGAEILPKALIDFIDGKLKFKQQDDSLASYVKMLKKENGKIGWNKPAIEIERMVRAYNPWPGTYSIINYQLSIANKIIKILKVDNNILLINKYAIGEIFLHNNKLAVQCGNGALVLEIIQLEGKKQIKSMDFLKGHREIIGNVLR